MSEEPEAPKHITINVNGMDYPITGAEPVEASYEMIVETAHRRLPEKDEVFTVTYSGKPNGDVRRSGSLTPGEKVLLEDGMVFTALVTGNS